MEVEYDQFVTVDYLKKPGIIADSILLLGVG